mgnify:CR=1 FL=1
MHPHYSELIDKCLEAIKKQPDGRLSVTTNGSNTSSIFKNHHLKDQPSVITTEQIQDKTQWDNIRKEIEVNLSNNQPIVIDLEKER